MIFIYQFYSNYHKRIFSLFIELALEFLLIIILWHFGICKRKSENNIICIGSMTTPFGMLKALKREVFLSDYFYQNCQSEEEEVKNITTHYAVFCFFLLI